MLKKIICLLLISIILTAFSFPVVYAQNIWKDVNWTDINTIKTLIVNIINLLLSIVATVAVLFMVIGGIKYITSAGNPEGIESAKNTILYSVIGTLLSIMAFAIVTFISNRLPTPTPMGPQLPIKQVVTSLTNGLLAIAGTIAVLFIIIGGFQYITSAGDPDAIEKAKNTILYAVIGLLACILSYAVINFVVTRIT